MNRSNKAEHVRWSDIVPEHLNPLFDRQYVVGNEVMVARISMSAAAWFPSIAIIMSRSATFCPALCAS